MRAILVTILCSLWLPMAMVVVATVRFGTAFLSDHGAGPGGAVLFDNIALLWLAGIPLAEAVRRLARRSVVLAVIGSAILGPVTVFATTVGGILGPFGVLAPAIVLSAPAWLVVAIVAYRRRRSHPFGFD